MLSSKPASSVNNIVFENLNGSLYITKNGIRTIVPILKNNNVTFNFDDSLLTADNLTITNYKISARQTNNIVSNGTLKHIDAPNILLILTAIDSFVILPNGNINVANKIKVDKSIALIKRDDMWNLLSYNTEVRKEVIVPVEKIIERIVDVPVEREVIVQKIVRKEVIIEKEVIVNRVALIDKPINEITYVITPALNPAIPLYQRELKVIKHLSSFKHVHVKILTQHPVPIEMQEILVGVECVLLEKTNDKGLIQLSDIFKHGLSNSDAMIYTNSDCILDPKYIDKILKVKDIDFLMRLNDGKHLYKIGLDGFYLTKAYYETLDYCFNFYVGEPFWDVSFYNLIKKVNSNASVDTLHLTHDSHAQNWDISKLSECGKFNESLHSFNMKRFDLKYGLDWKESSLSVVIVFYGQDEIRLKNLHECVAKLKQQRYDFELIVVEANASRMFDGNVSIYKFISMNSNNNDLWQKEALMNIGSTLATRNNLLFLDSDVYCDDLNWLKSIDECLTLENVYLQPFKTCVGSLFKSVGFYSRAYVDSQGEIENKDWLHNPGLCVGIRKDSFVKNKMANPFYLYGCGDSGMYYEMTNIDGNSFYDCNKFLLEIKRRCCNKLAIKYLDFALTHVDHGILSDSYYRGSIRTPFADKIKDTLELDSSELVCWSKENKVIKSVLTSKYKNKDLLLTCDGFSNQLILLLSVLSHFKDKHKICFPQLKGCVNAFPNLTQYICDTNDYDKITYDMLNLNFSGIVNDQTIDLLKPSKLVEKKLESYKLNFNNSLSIIELPNYVSKDVFEFRNVYWFGDEAIINNVGTNITKLTRNSILDLLTASKCSKIVRNKTSSFGWLASMIGKQHKTLKDERLV